MHLYGMDGNVYSVNTIIYIIIAAIFYHHDPLSSQQRICSYAYTCILYIFLVSFFQHNIYLTNNNATNNRFFVA
jgi:hypothetical protein